jgi:Protein of unknown function (DUF5672)
MLNLNQLTLLCIDNRTPQLSIWAMQQCLNRAQFGRAILVTDCAKVSSKPHNIELIQAPPINSIHDYSMYLMSDLGSMIEGTHALIMQWDSFIIDETQWDTRFLEYDYIGAPWPHHPETPVGNGGFSLRSKKLFATLQDPRFIKSHPEDQCICIFNRALLEDELALKFAPVEIAKKFAFEREYSESFGFHGFFNFAKIFPPEELKELIKMMPLELLGKKDTYDLIDHLFESNQLSVIDLLLKKSSPVGKMWKKHLRRWLLWQFKHWQRASR